MDASTFAAARAADPTCRVFVDRYGGVGTAHLTGGLWLAHPASTEPGATIDEDRLFSDRYAWQAEQDRVQARRYRPGGDLVDVRLPSRPSLGFERRTCRGPLGGVAQEDLEVFGDLVTVVERVDLSAFLAANPGAVVV